MGSRNPPKPASEIKQLDQSVVEIVEGINDLLITAQSNNLTAVRAILEDARESIAWWATHDDYNESQSEIIAHYLSYKSALSTAVTLLAKLAVIKDETIRQELLEAMKQNTSRDISSEHGPDTKRMTV